MDHSGCCVKKRFSGGQGGHRETAQEAGGIIQVMNTGELEGVTFCIYSEGLIRICSM